METLPMSLSLDAREGPQSSPELGIILPTFNEKANIIPILDALRTALPGQSYEVIVVDDDSEDGTASHARATAARYPELRVIQRINRHGLASACVEGMMASHSPYLAVMDCDLQHDEQILPEMLRRLKNEDLDLVIGTRNAAGGSMGEFAAGRKTISDTGRRLSKLIYSAEVSDPMSGFFVLDRRFLEEVVRSLSMTGYKILLDLLASSKRPVRLGEVGYTFRNRVHGESKLDLLVSLEYLELLFDKLIGDYIPPRFIFFCGVGLAGLALNVLLFEVISRILDWDLDAALISSSLLVITVNYYLNNQFTFRQFRLKGTKWWKGLVLFHIACSIGLVANLGIADGLVSRGISRAAAVLGGVAVGSLWNYAMSSILVWGVRRRRIF
jgi:dolichol-phosphate mannosyltransferase